ncbi:MAG: nucleoside triphosphate pyrophosphohydrolase [Desulfobacteraceae bacterium]|jgi:tetrapyrrole methylase family protein/MazG family protein/ATP diphosphatase|nr:MAG: nucleoside triphosphate pyrophosphohydrolase [Desulfobacteraceae bacterium]
MEKETPSVNKLRRDRAPESLLRLIDLMARLRGPGGCPWDAKQTDTTIKGYLLEEAYEVLEAVERSSPTDVCQELGDLLFQIIFLARLAEERDEFDLVEVMDRIAEKMIRRHPHVFGEAHVEGAEEVASNWAKIKKAEHGDKGDTAGELRSIPGNLPSLLRSHRISERASKAGIPVPEGVEGLKEMEDALERIKTNFRSSSEEASEKALGDLLFGAASIARHLGLNTEHLLRVANDTFIRKVSMAEDDLRKKGLSLDTASRDQIKKVFEK